MVWVFVGMGIAATLLGLAILTVRLPRIRLPHPRPQLLIRGCVALICLVAALTCGGLALLAALWSR